MKAKIRIAKPVEREYKKKDGTAFKQYSQAVLISQFPHQDATEWHTCTDEKYLYPVGLFEADAYLSVREYKDKEGNTKRQKELRFANFKSVDAE